IAHVEKTVPAQAREGLVLRYGGFYGPGTGDFLVEAVRKRQGPGVGGGAGGWAVIEITDAAAATLAAVGRGAPGVYNVVDSDPAPVAEWLPYLAEILGAKPPRRGPAWLGRLLAGEFVVAQMTSSRGYSNERTKKELGWEPRYASWREGFRAWVSGGGGAPAAAVLDRLRDDRSGGRRRGHRAGRVPGPDPGAPGGNHDRRSEGVPGDGSDPAGHQLPELGAGAARDVRGGLAARAGHRA